MPHLRFRGIEKKEVKEISKELIDGLVDIIECPRDYFTIEHIDSTFIFDGEENTNMWPFIDILWFDRGSKTMQEVANFITKLVNRYPHDDVTINFTNLKEEHYFENGQHF